MTDIVWSLRNDVPCNGDIGCSYELCNQAADEITRLRAENEKLREWNREIALNAREFVAENEKLRAALREYVCNCPKGTCEYFPCGEFARAALEETSDE